MNKLLQDLRGAQVLTMAYLLGEWLPESEKVLRRSLPAGPFGQGNCLGNSHVCGQVG